MKVRPFAWLVFLVAAGCQSDNQISGKNDEQVFDTGGTVTPPITDSAEDTAPEDTSVEPVPSYCQDRFFDAEAVLQDATCEGGPATPDWDLEVIWETQAGSGSYTPAVVGQLNDDDGDGDADADDIPDIVILDTSAVLHVLNGNDGSELWQRMITNTETTIPTIGDLDGDGFPEIVTDVNYSTVALSGEDGSTVWTGPSSYLKNKGYCGAHGIGDLDGDGDPEVYYGSQIIDGQSGSLRGNGDEGDGLGVGNSFGISIAADIDNNGDREVIVGNAAYDADGNTVWANGGTDATVAVADLDLDGTPELVSVGNYGVITMDNEGDEIWTADLGGALASTPVLADLTGDLYPEVIIPTSSTLYVFDGDGDELWSVTDSGSASGRGGASAYDLDGNGTWEVIWAGPSNLMILDGNGDRLASYSQTGHRCAGPVAVADVDQDDHADIVTVDTSGRVRAFRDTAGFTDARGVWNQSDYSLTNVEDDGSIPSAPTPNWRADNNFRAGPAITQVQSLYPVIRDVCSEECADGTVWIWYSIANNGFYDLNGRLDLEIWGQTESSGMVLLDTAMVSGNFEAGMMSASTFLELRDVGTPLEDIQVRIVGSSSELEECNESDDISVWGASVCP